MQETELLRVKHIDEILKAGADNVRKQTLPAIKEVKRLVGINKL